MKTDVLLKKAKMDILKLQLDNSNNNQKLINYILNVVKNKCGVYLMNQLIKETTIPKESLKQLDLTTH